MPPELYVDIDFKDDNNNKILEAQESGNIVLKVRNAGGDANGIKVSVAPDRQYAGLIFQNKPRTLILGEREETEVLFPLSATVDIPTDSLKFNIKVSEPMGYDINATMLLSTYEYQKAKMHVQGVTIIDSGRGLRASNNNPDGKIQRGEVVKAVVSIQNIGNGAAFNVDYSIKSSDPNVILLIDSGPCSLITGNAGNFLSGEVKEISFRMSANNNYIQRGQYLPIYLSIHEDKGFGDLASVNVPIPLGTLPAKPSIVDIKGDKDRLLALQQTKVYSSSSRISSNIKIKDISLAPAGEPIFRDAVAIVLGAEKNSYGTAPAPYAARDAKIMANYFKNSLGVQNIQVKTDEELTGTEMSDLFDPRYGYLARAVKPQQTDVFIYYSGHGIPDIASDGSQDIYLFPYDARMELVRERGYSLNRLYADLNALNAKSVTVILDACFSGTSRQTETYQSENITREKGVRISMPELMSRPWDTNPNFRLFSSSTGNQTSLGYDQSQSGLFTYYLALALQGEADADFNGEITMDELVSYVSENVSRESMNIRGSMQTPEFLGNGNFIIEKIK